MFGLLIGQAIGAYVRLGQFAIVRAKVPSMVIESSQIDFRLL